MEEELVRWLRNMGYRANDTVLTRAGASKLMKSNNRPVWEFLIDHVKPSAEAQQIREDSQTARQGGFNDAQEVKQAKQRARLRVQRRQQQEQNKAIQDMLARQGAHLQALLAETVSEQGQRASIQQEAVAVGAQIQAAVCYKERMLKALAILRQLQAGLHEAAAQAKAWAAALQAHAAKALPGLKKPDTEHVSQVARACASVQTELQTRSILAMQQSDLRAGGGDKAGTILLSPPTNNQELGELCASATSPLVTLEAIIEVMHQSVFSLKDKCAVASAASSTHTLDSDWRAAPSSSGLDPQLLLRQRQQAHVDKFFATEDMLNQVEDTMKLIKQRRAAAEPLLAWPYNHLKLQEAWLLAELSTLRSEIARLNQELMGRHEAEAALQDQWRSVYEASCYSQQAHGLLERLIKENRDMTVGWGEDAAGHQAWCQGVLSDSVEAAASSCHQGLDVLQSELGAASQLNLAACPPSLHGTSQQDALHQRSSSMQPLAQQQQATVLFSYSRAVPAAALERSQSGLTGRHRSGNLYKSVPLPLVLQAACSLDALAPLRCPASILCTTTGQQEALRLMQQWLHKTKPWLSASALQVQTCSTSLQPLQRQVMQLIHPPSDPRLAVVKKYVATAQGMQTYAQTRVGRALSDWKTLPAVHLLPDVQYAGLNAAEWLSAIEALLVSIREAQGLS